jgi:uncharacterized protein YqgC (DUF456 family)
MTILASVAFLLIWLVSLAGLIVPVIPGVPLAAVGALLAAWMTGFENLDLVPLLIIGLLAVLAQVLDFAGSWLGAKYYGASSAGMWGGIIGSLVGVLVAPPFGFLPGALLGALAFELLAGRQLAEAWKSGIGSLLGALGGTFMKLLILIAMGIITFMYLF